MEVSGTGNLLEASPVDSAERYALHRARIDVLLPQDRNRTRARVKELQNITFQAVPMDHHADTEPYDIFDCPDEPPPGYPWAWSLVDMLQAWPPSNPTVPPMIHQSLCVFDFESDYDKAIAYREAEVPFVVVNDPSVDATVERWSYPGYLSSLLADDEHPCEVSDDNHFMYYYTKHDDVKKPADWKVPTRKLKMSFDDFVQHANNVSESWRPDSKHYYYRLIACGDVEECYKTQASSEFLFDELPFFQPTESLYMKHPSKQKGIHCRFGMKGVIAENHFDQSRNFVVLLGGSRRYILAHPDQCENLVLHPKGHPSARHSQVNWDNPDLHSHPEFANAMANEIVLQAGHLLYIPTHWFHFIVSLDLNYQCNTRSGKGFDYIELINTCGF